MERSQRSRQHHLISELLLPLVLVFESVCVIRYVCVLFCVNVMKRNAFLSYLKTANRCPEEILFFQKIKTLNKKIAL